VGKNKKYMDRLNLISVRDQLSKNRLLIFSVRDFVRIFKVLPKTARAFLSFNTKKGSFKRLKMGIYIVSNNPPSSFEIANYLQRPSYLSFETALSFYGIIPETVYTITSATTKPYKEFNLQGQNYRYNKIKKELFFGYQPIKVRETKVVLIADKEKAVLDYIYLLSLKKQSINERINLNKIDKEKLGKYIGFFKRRIRKNKAFINFIKQLHI